MMKNSKASVKHELQEHRILFQNILQSADSMLLVLSEDLRIREWNRLAGAYLGFGEKDVRNMPLEALEGVEYLPLIFKALEDGRKTKKSIEMPDIRWKDWNGANRYLSIRVVPIIGGRKSLMGFLLICDDITHSREMQRQHEEGQKFRAIGELAAGIAHEINTPVQFVQNNLVYLGDSMKEAMEIIDGHVSGIGGDAFSQLEKLFSDFPDAISQSLEGIERIAKITRSLRNYSHPGTGRPESFDPVKAIQDAITLSVNEWKKTVKVDFRVPEEPMQITGFPSQLSQAVVNLIVNACHALNERYDGESLSRGYIRIRITSQEEESGKIVRFTVEDNGTGMPEKVRNRIFEPFFTTKPLGKGTGQGLAQVYSSIVRTHKGQIQVDSVQGEGTLFTITLPGGI